MQRALLPVLFAISTGCAVATPDGDTGGAAAGGKADALGTVPATGTWTKAVVSDSSTLWNGGPSEVGRRHQHRRATRPSRSMRAAS